MVSTMDAALKHAKSLAEYLSKCDVTYIVHFVLKEIGIPTGSDGFRYAKYTALMLIENPCVRLKNGAYTAAGRENDPEAEDDQVEQAIRHAIKSAWKDRDEEVWRYYFPIGKPGRYRCPSNKEFLFAVVDFVVLWKACCEEVNYAGK